MLVIDTNSDTVVDTIMVGNGPYGIAFDPIHSTMYVSNGYNNTVSVINTNTNLVVDTIKVGDGPAGIAFQP